MVKFCTCGSIFWWSWKKIICFCYSIKILITEYNVLRITKKRKTVLRNCDKVCCNLVCITLGGLENPFRMMSWTSTTNHNLRSGAISQVIGKVCMETNVPLYMTFVRPFLALFSPHVCSSFTKLRFWRSFWGA